MVIGFLWMRILFPKKPLFTLDLHSTRQLLAMLSLCYTELRWAICRVICPTLNRDEQICRVICMDDALRLSNSCPNPWLVSIVRRWGQLVMGLKLSFSFQYQWMTLCRDPTPLSNFLTETISQVSIFLQPKMVGSQFLNENVHFLVAEVVWNCTTCLDGLIKNYCLKIVLLVIYTIFGSLFWLKWGSMSPWSNVLFLHKISCLLLWKSIDIRTLFSSCLCHLLSFFILLDLFYIFSHHSWFVIICIVIFYIYIGN